MEGILKYVFVFPPRSFAQIRSARQHHAKQLRARTSSDSPGDLDSDVLTFMYREVVGVLMWTATMTRLDIAFAVRAVARFWKPWTAVLLNDGDAGHTLPDSHERVGDHVW